MNLKLHPRAALKDSRVHLTLFAVGALVLCVELWGVSSAVAARGAELCLTSASAQRTAGRHCIADRLVGDTAGTEQLAQYLKGNCQGVPHEPIIASYRPGQPIIEAAGPVCATNAGGST
jgi:hypothetical protein